MAHDLELARAAHVLAVVLWIGGVGFVTTVLIGVIRREHAPQRRMAAFLRHEAQFAWQARVTVAVVGISGFWIVHRLALWDRFRSADYWWMHAMVGVWIVFALMLYVLEPLFLHRALHQARRPERAFRGVEVMHWVLLAVSLTTVFGAVAGAHGVTFG